MGENPFYQLEESFDNELNQIGSLKELGALKGKYLGKKGIIKTLFQKITLSHGKERAEMGKSLNLLAVRMKTNLNDVGRQLSEEALNISLEDEWQDLTLPGLVHSRGAIHTISETERICLRILRQFGFEFVEGPEVETDFFNFDALNIPLHHPARYMQDTFWLKENFVLRSHTTTVQARVLERRPELPIRVASSGRVYRNEKSDATHTAMFHQLEGFWVDRNVNFPHLKGILMAVAQALYGEKSQFRFKPKYYPYTEPSIGMDILCDKCEGSGCRSCHQNGWVTIIGAGMIHPKVLKRFGYVDSDIRGFAFGWGISRMACYRAKLLNVKDLYSTNHRLLSEVGRRGNEN